VHPIGTIPLDQAALIEPLSVGYHAYVRSGAKAGDIALIGGAGPIGLLTAAVLKANGITVIMSELSELRRQKALDTGVADHALNPAEVDVVQEVRRLSGGAGADVAFECSSVNVVLDTLFDAIRPGGVIVVVAIWGHPAQLDLQKLVLKEVDMRGTIAYMGNHPDVIRLVQDGKIQLAPFITGKIGLEHLIDEGFDTLIHHNDTAVKILVSPSGRGLG
jgi:(R,R)-butanediol dehydrogenase/meso-butanediol dehydrogenase/diacetyl reductase